MKKINGLLLLVLCILLSGASAYGQTAAEVWLSYADKHYAAKQFDKAIAGYDKVLISEPGNYEATLRKGLCYYNLNDTPNAVFWLEKASLIKASDKVSNFILQLKNSRTKETSSNFAASGGSARLYALANAAIALPDEESRVDMYSRGFTSSYLQRPAVNFASISPAISAGGDSRVMTTTAYYKDPYFEFSANNPGSMPAKTVFWFSKDNMIVFVPGFARSSTVQENYNPYMFPVTKTTIDVYDTKWKVAAEYGHRILPALALGAYISYDNLLHSEESRLAPGSTGKSTVDVRSLSWMLSATYLFKFGADTFSLCLAGGSRPPHKRFEAIDTMSPYYDYTVFGRSGYEQTVVSEDMSVRFDMKKKYSISAYDAWLGAGYVNPGVFDAASKIYYTPAIEIRDRVYSTLLIKLPGITNTLEDFDRPITHGMSAAGFEAYARFYFPWLTAGAGISTDYIFGKHEPNIGNTVDARTTAMEWCAGVNITALSKFNFPMQFYYSSSQIKDVGNYNTSFNEVETFGFLGGAEYNPDKNLSFRAGIKYLYGGSVDMIGPPDYAFEANMKYGDKSNPATSITGLYFGAGYVLGQWEFNLAVGTETKKKIPTPSYDTETFTGGKTDVMLDVRFGF